MLIDRRHKPIDADVINHNNTTYQYVNNWQYFCQEIYANRCFLAVGIAAL